MADIAYRHSPGIQADNHRIQAIEAPLSCAYQAWGEGACPVPGNLDLEGSHLRYHGLLRRAVPRVRARLTAGLALLIPQMLRKLSGKAALQGLLKQRGQQPLTARHLDLASIKTLKQRIQRPRATQLLHSLTPTSARHNIIIIHHASILSNKKTDTQTIEHALDRRKIGHNHTPLPHTNTRIHPPIHPLFLATEHSEECNEAGAPQWVSPASCVQCSRDQCPGQLRIDVSAATE